MSVMLDNVHGFALTNVELTPRQPLDHGQPFMEFTGPSGKEVIILAQSAPGDRPWWQNDKFKLDTTPRERVITGPAGTVYIDENPNNADHVRVFVPKGARTGQERPTVAVPRFRVEDPQGRPLRADHPMAKAVCAKRAQIIVGKLNADRPEGKQLAVVESGCPQQ